MYIVCVSFLFCLFSSALGMPTQVQDIAVARLFESEHPTQVCPIDWNSLNLTHVLASPSVGPFNGCGGCLNVTDVPLTRHTYVLAIDRSPTAMLELGLGAFEDLFGSSEIGTQKVIAWSITGQSFCSHLLYPQTQHLPTLTPSSSPTQFFPS
ncbi:hypothetical protein J3Q64DRAFT_1761304 [Phycomyces blakesleeanus]|uniref:Secreted protein n=2 Tax=Phycomyces blakesleeanus TaxID=4837 RepID=A0ABR3ARA4_PHYBL